MPDLPGYCALLRIDIYQAIFSPRLGKAPLTPARRQTVPFMAEQLYTSYSTCPSWVVLMRSRSTRTEGVSRNRTTEKLALLTPDTPNVARFTAATIKSARPLQTRLRKMRQVALSRPSGEVIKPPTPAPAGVAQAFACAVGQRERKSFCFQAPRNLRGVMKNGLIGFVTPRRRLLDPPPSRGWVCSSVSTHHMQRLDSPPHGR